VQHDGDALGAWQVSQRSRVVHLLDRHRRGRARDRFHPSLEKSAHPISPVHTHGEPQRDPAYPGIRAVVMRDALPSDEEAGEGLLGHFLGARAITEDALREPHDSGVLGTEEGVVVDACVRHVRPPPRLHRHRCRHGQGHQLRSIPMYSVEHAKTLPRGAALSRLTALAARETLRAQPRWRRPL